MPTIIQWIHVMAAIISLGGLGFMLLILLPSLGVLSAEQRDALSRSVASRFRWATWSAVTLLLLSGLYNVRRFYWEEPPGTAWNFLTLKVLLSFVLFVIVLALTIPFRLFEPLRTRRKTWLLVAFVLGIVIVLISAYLRRS
jgi:uncharacterized membrane protein